MGDWKGIVTDTSDVDETPGVSVYQQNTRMRISGELQRRQGFIATGLSKANGALLNLAGGSGFIVTGIDGQADGVPDTISAITGPTRRPPIIDAARSGGPWATSANWGGSQLFSVFGSCAGSIEVRTALGGPATVWIGRSSLYGGTGTVIVLSNKAMGTNDIYTVQVPWSADLPWVTLIEPGVGPGSHNGASFPWCF